MVADYFLCHHLHYLRDVQLLDEQVLFVQEREAGRGLKIIIGIIIIRIIIFLFNVGYDTINLLFLHFIIGIIIIWIIKL